MSVLRRVMVVDDDPAILRLLTTVLEVEGWDIVACERAEQALAVLEKERPALVVTELELPTVSGEEFYQRARAGGFEGQFIVISGEPNGRMKSARMGAVHVQKPFDPYHLLELIEELVDSQDRAGSRQSSNKLRE